MRHMNIIRRRKITEPMVSCGGSGYVESPIDIVIISLFGLGLRRVLYSLEEPRQLDNLFSRYD
ncbi:MAG: hypothetical protein ACXAAO_12890 [Candidatus Thorarchaeota archaeon]